MNQLHSVYDITIKDCLRVVHMFGFADLINS